MGQLKIGKYYGDDTSKKTYLFSENLEEGYKDITSIDMIVMSADFTNKDFLFTRDFLLDYTSNLDLTTITDKEKHLLCQYNVLPYDDMINFYDDVKATVLVNDVNTFSIKSLKTRKENVIDLFNDILPSNHLNSLSIDISIDNTPTLDLSSIVTTIDSATYLSNENKITIKNILNGEAQKGQSDDIYKIKE